MEKKMEATGIRGVISLWNRKGKLLFRGLRVKPILSGLGFEI